MAELLPHFHEAAPVLLVRGHGRLSNQPFTRFEVVVDQVRLDAELLADREGGEGFSTGTIDFGHGRLEDRITS